MKLFGLGKEKEDSQKEKEDSQKEKEASQKGCACGGACEATAPAGKDAITGNNVFNTVKVLGFGCKKCNELEAATIEALKKLGMDTKIEHVTDFTQIADYGVMITPALVIDEKVVSYGKVLKTEEVVKILEKERG